MGFHKYTFPIRQIEATGEPIKVVTGWTNEDYTIGFHKVYKDKRWAATDLYTGTYYTIQDTRQKCLDWIAAHQDVVKEKMESPAYIQRVMEFKRLLEKEMEEL